MSPRDPTSLSPQPTPRAEEGGSRRSGGREPGGLSFPVRKTYASLPESRRLKTEHYKNRRPYFRIHPHVVLLRTNIDDPESSMA